MSPELSVVVVAYDMARELPRTIRSLCPPHQLGIDPSAYEVIVVDNGSPIPVDRSIVPDDAGVEVRIERLDPAPPSPAAAANRGIEVARGDAVGLIVDGARMASPGLLATASLGLRLVERPVVATLGWHLGAGRHGDADNAGHDAAAEDALLEQIGWPSDGYRLFEISTLGNTSARGWFGPMGMSSALFMPRSLWREVGGLDAAFALPGGGLVNHDLYRRAVSAEGARVVMVLGEGTFHQTHGGATTSGRFGWEEMQADYERLRGERFSPVEVDPLYVGTMPAEARPHLMASLEWLRARHGEQPGAQRRRLRYPSALKVKKYFWTSRSGMKSG